MRAYDRGGGGMLAAALAYFAFFTMVPALLLFVSLLGIVVEDRNLREQLVTSLVDRLDPVSEVASTVIDGSTIRTVGVIGPTRMHYSRAISLVDGTTQAVSRVLRDAN